MNSPFRRDFIIVFRAYLNRYEQRIITKSIMKRSKTLLDDYLENQKENPEYYYCDMCGHRIELNDALAKASVISNDKETDDQSE